MSLSSSANEQGAPAVIAWLGLAFQGGWCRRLCCPNSHGLPSPAVRMGRPGAYPYSGIRKYSRRLMLHPE